MEGTDEARESGSQSGDGDDVLNVLILLQHLVDVVDGVPPRSDVEQEGSPRIIRVVGRTG